MTPSRTELSYVHRGGTTPLLQRRKGVPMGRLVRFIVICVVLALVGLGAYAWVQGRDEVESPFETFAVERGDIVEKAVAIGQIDEATPSE